MVSSESGMGLFVIYMKEWKLIERKSEKYPWIQGFNNW